MQLERRIAESELGDEDTIEEDVEEAMQNHDGLVSDDEEEEDLAFNLDSNSSDLYLSGNGYKCILIKRKKTIYKCMEDMETTLINF